MVAPSVMLKAIVGVKVYILSIRKYAEKMTTHDQVCGCMHKHISNIIVMVLPFTTNGTHDLLQPFAREHYKFQQITKCHP